jgi:hypothetical protein
MDALTMAGAWAGALLAIVTLTRMAYLGLVKAIRMLLREELSRVWKDQDEIEQRLSALEASLVFIREQIEQLREMMQAHIEEK